MIADKDTNTIYFSELLKTDYKFSETSKQIISTLDTFGANYKFLPETKDIWAVDANKKLHLYGFIISTDTAGKVEIYIDTELFHPFIFNDKKSVPLALPFEFWLPQGKTLKAKWTSDTNSGNAYITPIGYET